ncbi:MAG: C45 family peptidase [Smithella sp.]
MKVCYRIAAVVLLIVIVNFLYTQPVFASKELKFIAAFEDGRLYRSGKINVLVLHGSYHQMGRQYGRLLGKELKALYKNALVDYFQKQKGLSADSMKKKAKSLYHLYPQRFKDIINGMAETSGLSLDQQIMLNSLESYGSMSGCSGIIVWGPFTKDHSLIAGRNYDWFDKYTEFAQNLTLTVFNPDSGIPNAIITFAGVIYATTGMNESGIFLELNNGLPSGGTLSYSNRIPAIVNLMACLSDYRSMDQVDAFFNTTRTNFSFIINTADKSRAISYEWAPFEHRQRKADMEGLLVATNHFTDPSWGIILRDNAGFETVRRQENLLTLGDKNKGEIDLKKMQEILDKPMDEGGATWPSRGHIRTVYQIIAVPESLQIRLKVPGYQDWTDVDLKELFIKNPAAHKCEFYIKQ